MAAHFSAADYTAALRRLLPRGRVWPTDAGTVQEKAIGCFAPLLEDLDAAGVDILVDAFPTSTSNLLPEWQSTLGLPDLCLGPNPTRQQELAQVEARFTDGGGQSAAHFISFAAKLGFEITIGAYAPFRAGRTRVGQPLCGPDWAHAWLVTIVSDDASAGFAAFRIGTARAGDALSSSAAGHDTLLCELNRMAPAHMVLLFSY